MRVGDYPGVGSQLAARDAVVLAPAPRSPAASADTAARWAAEKHASAPAPADR